MISSTRNCTFCHVDTVELAPGETFRFEQKPASGSFGFFGLGGGTTMLEGAVPGRTFTGFGQWCPNNADLGWSNDAVGHSYMLLQAMPEGAKWLCLSNNSGSREVQHLKSEGSATVPAGFAVVVATGSVSFEGKTAAQFAYIRPRDADYVVTGSADLLLVR